MFDLFLSGFLKHPSQQNPCYRKVLSYALFRFHNENFDDDELETVIVDLKDKFDNGKPYKLERYFGLYPFTVDSYQGNGYLIVDASRPVFPLVIYSQSSSNFNSKPNQPRYSALRVAILDINRNRKKLIEIFNRHTQWSFELERELERIFKYKNDLRISEHKMVG